MRRCPASLAPRPSWTKVVSDPLSAESGSHVRPGRRHLLCRSAALRISLLLQAPAGSEQKWTVGTAPVATWLRVRGSSTDAAARARLELLRGGSDLVASALGERRSPLDRASLGEGHSAQIVGQEFGRDSWRIQADASAMREASLEPRVEVVLGCRERGQRTKSRVSMWPTTMLSR